MISVRYDMRRFEEILYNTKLYQAKGSLFNEEADLSEIDLKGPLVRRMTGEQIYDSILALSYGSEIDEKKDNSLVLEANLYQTVYDYFNKMDSGELEKSIVNLMSAFDRKNKKKIHLSDKEKELLNLYSTLNRKKTINEKIKQVKNQLKNAENRKNQRRVQQLKQEIKEKKNLYFQEKQSAKMLRSGVLTTSTQNGHFVRIFGGSDRETVESGNQNPEIIHAFSLMNGNWVNLSQSSEIVSNLKNIPNFDGKVKLLYQTMLIRNPTQKEIDFIYRLKNKYGEQEAIKRWIWVLLNNHEFMYIL